MPTVTDLGRRIPLVRSLAGYRRADLGSDLVAGILITATAVPLGVGFASAAGLSPITGLYTSILPLIVFGLLCSTRQVKLGLDAASAAMIGSAIVPLAMVGGNVDQGRLTALVALVSLVTGAILLVAGLARAGFLADLLSMPLLVGYQAGIAISVIIGQLPKLLGAPAGSGSDLAKLADLAGKLGKVHPATLLAGVAAIAALVALRQFAPKLPAALLVLVAGTVASALWLDDRGVAVIGALPSGLPQLVWPSLGDLPGQWQTIVGTSASLALVIASDVLIASRSFAARGHYRVSANTDIRALGLAQMASAVSGGATASASYTRTAVAERAGSRTQISSLVGGILMAIVVATMTGLLKLVPLTVLAAICIDACWRLIELPAFRRLWVLRRSDFLIALVTVVLVLATDLLLAIAVAVGFSLLTFLRRAVWPDESRLGQRAGINGWYSLDDYDDAQVIDESIVVYRWNAPLIFANVHGFAEKVEKLCPPSVRWLVIDCSAIFDVDPSALDVLGDLIDTLRAGGTQVALAEPAPDVVRMLRRGGVFARLGPAPRAFVDVETAVAALTDAGGAGGGRGGGRGGGQSGVLIDPNGDDIYEYVSR